MFKLHKPQLSGSIHSGHFMVSRLDDDDENNDAADDSSESERENANSVEIDVTNPESVVEANNLDLTYQVGDNQSSKNEHLTSWNDLDRPAKHSQKQHQYLTYYTNSSYSEHHQTSQNGSLSGGSALGLHASNPQAGNLSLTHHHLTADGCVDASTKALHHASVLADRIGAIGGAFHHETSNTKEFLTRSGLNNNLTHLHQHHHNLALDPSNLHQNHQLVHLHHLHQHHHNQHYQYHPYHPHSHHNHQHNNHHHHHHHHQHAVTIDTSLTKLLECMSLYYSGKLTSPKWKSFKGLKLRLKYKIRLNNLIWRAWFLQCIRGRRPPGCQFTAPVETDVHKKSETIVLEGKYWKRREQAIVDEYKKWRTFHKQKSQMTCFRPSSFDWDSRVSNVVYGPEFQFDPDYDMNISYNLDDLPPLLNEIETTREVDTYYTPSTRMIESQPSTNANNTVPTTTPTASSAIQHQQQQQHQQHLQSNIINNQQHQHQFSAPQATQQQHLAQLQQVTNATQISTTTTPTLNNHNSTNINNSQQPLSLKRVQPAPTPASPLSSAPSPVARAATPTATSEHQQQALSLSSSAVTPATTSQQPQHTMLPHQYAHLQPHLNPNLIHHQAQSTSAHVHAQAQAHAQAQIMQQQQQHLQQQQQQQRPFQPFSFDANPQGVYQHLSEHHHHHLQSFPTQTTQAHAQAQHQQQQQQHQQQQQNHHHQQQNHVQPMQHQQRQSHQQQQQQQLHVQAPPVRSADSMSLASSPELYPIAGTSGERTEQRRVCHINAEQKRRCNIKNGFDTLKSILPSINQNVNIKISKASMLQKAAHFISVLSNEQAQKQEEKAMLKREIENLKQTISAYQSQLPTSGGPVSHGTSQAREMLQEYIRARTLSNWKFWIFSMLIEPMFDSYYNTVSTNSLEESCKTIFTWLDRHCSLVSLRKDLLESLTFLSTNTSILNTPQTLPNESVNAVKYQTNGAGLNDGVYHNQQAIPLLSGSSAVAAAVSAAVTSPTVIKAINTSTNSTSVAQHHLQQTGPADQLARNNW